MSENLSVNQPQIGPDKSQEHADSSENAEKPVVIVGAGPAGLTAAYELLARGRRNVLVLEATSDIGGISKTVQHGDCRIDLGGHRFFSKSDEIMEWWTKVFPVAEDVTGKEDDSVGDNVFLVRNRLSRILFAGKYFSYPVSLSADTLMKLGPCRLVRMAFSYLRAVVRPIRPERSLEDFFINRFGRELYSTFFKDYTEKVWGIGCEKLSADWGAQRVKGLSVARVLLHALGHVKRLFGDSGDVAQKNVETSLIERFLYPKFGPGALWEAVADRIREMGGQILLGTSLEKIVLDESDKRVREVVARDARGELLSIRPSCLISSMPLKALISGIFEGRGIAVPQHVQDIAKGLVYRDFMTVGVLIRADLSGSRKKNSGTQDVGALKDNWIYVQEPGVKMGRIQIFNNWSPWLVGRAGHTLLGLEYFCNEGDELWTMADEDFIRMATEELEQIRFANLDGIAGKVADAFVVRVPKAYPAYLGTYDRTGSLRDWLNSVENLYPVGRNGMHRYNNMDHSMLSALRTVDAIMDKSVDKRDIWLVNAEKEYHESK